MAQEAYKDYVPIRILNDTDGDRTMSSTDFDNESVLRVEVDYGSFLLGTDAGYFPQFSRYRRELDSNYDWREGYNESNFRGVQIKVYIDDTEVSSNYFGLEDPTNLAIWDKNSEPENYNRGLQIFELPKPNVTDSSRIKVTVQHVQALFDRIEAGEGTVLYLFVEKSYQGSTISGKSLTIGEVTIWEDYPAGQGYDYLDIQQAEVQMNCNPFIRRFKNNQPDGDFELDGITPYTVAGEVLPKSKCDSNSSGSSSGDTTVNVDFTATNDLLGQIRDGIANNTAVLKQELDELELAVTAKIDEVIAKLNAGVDVNATQAGTWEVTVTNPTPATDLSNLANDIASALDGLNVTVSNFPAQFDVNVVNDKIVVTVDNLPVIPKDVEVREVCVESQDITNGEIYINTEYPQVLAYNDPNGTGINRVFGSGLDTVALPTYKSYLSSITIYDSNDPNVQTVVTLPEEKRVTILENATPIISPLEWLEKWHTIMAEYHTDFPPLESFKVTADYNIILPINYPNLMGIPQVLYDTLLGNGLYRFKISVEINGSASSIHPFQFDTRTSSGYQSIVNTTVTGKALQHIIYGETGQTVSSYLTAKDGTTVLTGEVVDCPIQEVNVSNQVDLTTLEAAVQALVDKKSNADSYVQVIDGTTSTTATGTNIVVAFYKGTGSFTLNGGSAISLNADNQYRSEVMDGTVTVTPDAGSEYHVSYTE